MGFQRVENVPTARGIDPEQFREGVELAGDPANAGQSFKWDEPVKSKSIKVKLTEHFNLGEFNEHGIRVDISFKPIKGQVEETYEVPAVPGTDEVTNEDGSVTPGTEGTPATTATRIVEKEVAFDMYFFGTTDPKPERKPRAPKADATENATENASATATAKPARGRAAAK